MDSIYGHFGALSDAIQAFGVAFRSRPSYVSVANGPIEAGFELELRGLHDCGFEHVFAGCAACRDLLFTLLDISDWVVPRGEAVDGAEAQHQRVTRYNHIFRECPETILTIKISRITTLDDIADGWISRYPDGVSSVLRQLGCRELYWGSERHVQDTSEVKAEPSYLAAKAPVAVIRRPV